MLFLWAEGSRLASKSSFVIALARGLASEARCPAALELERDPTVVNQPTTGTIVGTQFYYIANSQYGRLGDAGTLEPPTGAPMRTVVRVIDFRW